MIRNIFRESIRFYRLYSTKQLYKNIISSRGRQFDFLKECIINNSSSPMSQELIESIRQEVDSVGIAINANNFDSLFVDACILTCNFNLGKSFFLHILSKSDEIRLGVLGKFFKLCYSYRELCTEDDIDRLLCLYEQICQKYPFLDHVSTEHIIEGLSITPRWKDCLKLLKFAESTGEISSRMFNPIIIAAFIHRDLKLAKQLMTKAYKHGCKLNYEVYKYWLENVKDIDATLEDMFSFCSEVGVSIPPEAAEMIVNKYKRGQITRINNGGRCYACSARLSPLDISDEEFKELKDIFLSPVFVGNDIFIKSKPTEFQAFHDFLAKSGKVDVVLDGLNTAYSVGMKKPNTSHSGTLRKVIEHFAHLGKRVMVLGRKHMKKWPARDMSVLTRFDCPVFFLDDLSQDDPLILYAAMHSGKDTKFVSNDLMRGHKSLLKNPEVKKTFVKWQQKNQLFITHADTNGMLNFKGHVRYLIGAQKSNVNDWHCPLDEPHKPGLPPHIHLKNINWICNAP